MPKRPRSHKIEDFSRNQLRDIFTKCGWVVWDLHPDYGEDLLVRIFIDNVATHYSFFVQAKSTDHIARYINKDGKHLSFPIDIDHIEHWNHFWEPVILTLWDAQSDITYWESIQDYIDRYKGGKYRKKSLRIDLPMDNILNEEGLKRIVVRTKARFSRFEREREGAQVLINILEEELKVKIDYDPQHGSVFIEKPEGDVQMIAFGKFAAYLSRMASKHNLSGQELLELIENSVHTMARFYEQFPDLDINNDLFSIKDANGNVVRSHFTLNDLFRLYEREEELREYEEDT